MIHYFVKKLIPERCYGKIGDNKVVVTHSPHTTDPKDLEVDHIVGVDTQTGAVVTSKEIKIAEEMQEDVEYVKECIAAARKNKDEADVNIKCVLKQPEIDVKDEYHTGQLQIVKKVEVELMSPIIVKYAEDEETEFQTLLPVKIKIKRK